MCLAELIFAAVHFLPLGGCLLVAVSSPFELFLNLPSFSTVIRRLSVEHRWWENQRSDGFALLSRGDRPTGRFQIFLYFPGAEFPDRSFMVTTSMTVPTLERATARLLHVSTPLCLFVAPQLGALDHHGSIVSCYFSGTSNLCPYLQSGSSLHVGFRGLSDSSSYRDPFVLGARTRLVNSLPSHNPAIMVFDNDSRDASMRFAANEDFSSSPSLRWNNSVFDAVSPYENLQRNGESGASESDDETKIERLKEIMDSVENK